MQTGRKFRPPSDQFCGCDVSGDLALLPAAQRQWTHAGRTRASERASAALTHSRTDARARGSVSSPGGSSFQLYPRARPSRVSFFSLLFVFGCALSSLYSHWDHSLSYSLAPFHPLVFSLSLFFFFQLGVVENECGWTGGKRSERRGKRFAFDVFGQPIEFRRGTTSLKSRSE